MDEFKNYIDLKQTGMSALDVYRSAFQNGMNDIECVRMLRTVFGVSFMEAKEITLKRTDSSVTLDNHQDKIADGLGNVLRDDEV